MSLRHYFCFARIKMIMCKCFLWWKKPIKTLSRQCRNSLQPLPREHQTCITLPSVSHLTPHPHRLSSITNPIWIQRYMYCSCRRKKDVTKRNKYIFSPPALKLMKLWTFLLSPRPSLHCHMFGFLCSPASLTRSLLNLPRIKDSLSLCTTTWRSPPRMCSSLRRSKQFDNMLLLLPNMVIHIQEQPASRGSLQRRFLPVCRLTKEWMEKDVCLFFAPQFRNV